MAPPTAPRFRLTTAFPIPEALSQVFADPNCFSFQELFPGGFTPQFGGNATDASLVAGLRGQTSRGLVWDASVNLGSNKVDFFIFNTVNASLGPATPTEFDPGLYKQQDLSLNLDLSYALNERVNLAGGGEWRREHFEIGLGQAESWEIGPFAAQGFSAGSNAFPDSVRSRTVNGAGATTLSTATSNSGAWKTSGPSAPRPEWKIFKILGSP